MIESRDRIPVWGTLGAQTTIINQLLTNWPGKYKREDSSDVSNSRIPDILFLCQNTRNPIVFAVSQRCQESQNGWHPVSVQKLKGFQ